MQSRRFDLKKTRAEVARILGVSRAAVTQGVRAGRIVAEPDGTIDIKRNREYFESRLKGEYKKIARKKREIKKKKEPESKQKTGPGLNTQQVDESYLYEVNKLTKSYDQARTEFTELKSEKARIELEKIQGSLVESAEVQKAAFDIARKTRDRLLAVPDRISNLLATEEDPHKIREILDGELRRAMEDLKE